MQELAVLASRNVTLMKKFQSVADNIANADTDGYRRMGYEFKEIIGRPKGNETASYVADRAIIMDFNSGNLQETGNPLHAALGEEGFFAIDVNGTPSFTRRGHFVLNQNGELSTPEGHLVLDSAFAPIQLPPTAQNILFAEDGTISTEEGQITQLGVFTFAEEDMGKLQRAGTTGFIPQLGATPVPVLAPKVQQGRIESSNVNAVTELVNMQDVSRAYQSSLRAMRNLEQLEERAIRSLGNIQ